MRSKGLLWLSVVLGLLVIAVVAGAIAYPAAAAVACPPCYGFERVGPRLYVDAAAEPAARSRVAPIVAQARARVRDFYGSLDGDPRILVCATDGCYRRIGGGRSRGMALLDQALFLSPRGGDPVIASHELAHIELHTRIGLWKTVRRAIPQWFDEGLAVYVSNDPRYLAAPSATDRCLKVSDEAFPTQRSAWIEQASSRDLYATAACRVSRWLARNNGSQAAVDLARRVASGESFDAVYR